MKKSLKAGISFGVSSGVLTTIGLIVGLYASTTSAIIVLGGILTIAIADSASDGFGMHLSQEAQNQKNKSTVWEAASSTFFAKLLIALSFTIPIILLDLLLAVIVSVTWGIILLSITSYILAKQQKENPAKIILGHILLAFLVVIVTYAVGHFVNLFFL